MRSHKPEAGTVAAVVRWLTTVAVTDRCGEVVIPQTAAQLRRDIATVAAEAFEVVEEEKK
jgi:hypothetical protein